MQQFILVQNYCYLPWNCEIFVLVEENELRYKDDWGGMAEIQFHFKFSTLTCRLLLKKSFHISTLLFGGSRYLIIPILKTY